VSWSFEATRPISASRIGKTCWSWQDLVWDCRGAAAGASAAWGLESPGCVVPGWKCSGRRDRYYDMKVPPPHSSKIVTPPPPKKLPPVRMGDRSDAVRQNKVRAAEQHRVEAKIRTQIYRDILVLLDIADRLTVDLSAHEDRYGLEWNGLALQIQAQYSADVIKIVPGFQAKIMSKEGAQGLPKSLYRQLLAFADECAAFTKWARPIAPAPGADARESACLQAGLRFKQACVDMRQQICIFENERKAGEESFFG
jgi:hypothetical protein